LILRFDRGSGSVRRARSVPRMGCVCLGGRFDAAMRGVIDAAPAGARACRRPSLARVLRTSQHAWALNFSLRITSW